MRAHTTHPPARASSPQTPVYMVFQPIRCTAPGVATGTGEPLPHLFTNSPPRRRGCRSLLHCYTLSDIFPLGRMVLSVARTFLPGINCRSDETACQAAKLRNLTIIMIISPTYDHSPVRHAWRQQAYSINADCFDIQEFAQSLSGQLTPETGFPDSPEGQSRF